MARGSLSFATAVPRCPPSPTPAHADDTGLSYFHHSNDYYTEAGDGSMCHGVIDIYGTTEPAATFNTSAGRKDNMPNGTLEDYEEFKFLAVAKRIIADHPKDGTPLFLTYATHLVRHKTNTTTTVTPPLHTHTCTPTVPTVCPLQDSNRCPCS